MYSSGISSFMLPILAQRAENEDRNEVLSQPQMKSSYGASQTKDLRLNIYQLDQQRHPKAEQIKANAEGVACLIRKNYLIQTESGTYVFNYYVPTLNDRVAFKVNAPLKPTEKFSHELAPGSATGCLFRKRRIFAPGHYICKPKTSTLDWEKIRDTFVVFRFLKPSDTESKTQFETDEVYEIESVEGYQYDPTSLDSPDWCVLKLTKKVVNIRVIPFGPPPSNGSKVYALACHSGMAVKYAPGVIKGRSEDRVFCDVDPHAGGSGAPIINPITGLACAILVTGVVTEHIIDREHEGKTGELCAISFRLTQEMMSTYPLTGCQIITPEILDPHKATAKIGREQRKALSSQKSKVFAEKLERKKKSKHKKYLKKASSSRGYESAIVDIFAAISQSFISQEIPKTPKKLKDLEELSDDSNGRLNILEALFESRLCITPYSKDERALVAKNQVAYDLSEEQALKLHDLEVNVFNSRFSPNKVLDLLNYEESKKLEFDIPIRKKILKKMQENDREDLLSLLDSSERSKGVHEARVAVAHKALKAQHGYHIYAQSDLDVLFRWSFDNQKKILDKY